MLQDVITRVDQRERRIFGVCTPKNGTRSQYVKVFVKFAEASPERLHEDGGFLVDRPLHPGTRRSPNSSSKSEFGDSGHSRVSTDDWDKIAAERLHPKVATWRSRPKGACGGFLDECPVRLGT